MPETLPGRAEGPIPRLPYVHLLKAEGTVAKFVEHLPGSLQFNRRADPRSDHAICEHARNLV
jgi:hypothetical protein